MKRKRYKQRKKMKILKFQFQEFQKQKDMTETYLQDNVYEVQLNNGFKDRQLLNQAEGKDIDGTEPMSAKALEKSVPTANSNESDKSQNDFPTNSNNWHYLIKRKVIQIIGGIALKKKRKKCVGVMQKEKSSVVKNMKNLLILNHVFHHALMSQLNYQKNLQLWTKLLLNQKY